MIKPTARYITSYVIRGLFATLGTLVYPLLTVTFPIETVLRSVIDDRLVRFAPAAVSIMVVAGALLIEATPRFSRFLLSISSGIFAVAAVWASGFSPMVVFFAVLLFFIGNMWVWYSRSAAVPKVRGALDFDPMVMEIRSACIGALLVWGVQVGAGLVASLSFRISLLVAFGILILLGQKALHRGQSMIAVLKVLILGILLASVVLCVVTWDTPLVSVTWLVGIPAVGLFALHQAKTSRLQHRDLGWEGLFAEPYRLMFFSFLGTCLAGGFILALPIASAGKSAVGVIDALFTAVSATCVTGLAVVDTETGFSTVGQTVILILIQIGGLGIMTFSTAAILLLGKRLSLRYEGAISAVIGDVETLSTGIRHMVGITLVVELIGAALLSGLFASGGDTVGVAVFRAVFTAVSAYCNAGFALQSDSLMPYRHETAVLHVIAALIITGGIGPFVVAALPTVIRRKPLPLQHRIVLFTTVLLLVIPTFFITILEWYNTFADMSVWEKLTNGWFQAVTPRTAGFNSVNIADMHKGSIAIIEGLMFVGGSPGSTAGGVKTTTLAVLVLVVIATLRGREKVTVFSHQIAPRSVAKAMAVVVIAAGAVFVALIALLLTQRMSFEVAMFEVVSALGTVGLSIGGTPMLDGVGKVTVMILMFAGRLGPLSLFLLLGADSDPEKWRYPKQDIYTG